MSVLFNFNGISVLLIMFIQSLKPVASLNESTYILNVDSDSDIANFIGSKGYLPKENDLPKASIIKNIDNDMTFILSKLSDEELIKLLNDQPMKSEYELKDIVSLATGSNSAKKYKKSDQDKPSATTLNRINENRSLKKRFRTISEYNKPQNAIFRLENKQVDPYATKNDIDLSAIAVQKLNNLLYSRPIELDIDDKDTEDEEKKELLFNVLVAQLKTLCCKGSTAKKKHNHHYKSLLTKLTSEEIILKPDDQDFRSTSIPANTANEHMFLIINDDIKSNGSQELISVDPDSLEKNSTVLLLGLISSPLSDDQLKLVMNRISNELLKPEYLPLLKQLSEGTLNNIRLINSLITGPETRRYIKPHRCNHQSKLARVYGGPKWIICTGYLNLNNPSLYD